MQSTQLYEVRARRDSAPSLRGARAGFRAVLAATACWTLFTVLDHALGGRWWLWLLPGLLPPLLHLAVPVLLLALALALGPAVVRTRASGAAGTAGRVRRARRQFIPLLALLALLALSGAPRSGLHWGALLPGGGPEPAPADALKVFSWNTQYWDTTDDPAAFYRYLRAEDADVYLLQEHLARKDAAPAPLAGGLARLRAEFPGYHLVARGELVTLSRHPVVARRSVGGPEAAGHGAAATDRWTRLLRTDLNVGGRVISVYNVHISVQVDLERSWLAGDFYRTVRERDAVRRAQLAALERDAAASPHPVLISGDFNTTPAMGDLRGLREAFRDALPASSAVHPVTWNSQGLALWRLDWTFTDDRLRVHRYAFDDPAGLSDHRAQELVVSVRG